MEFVVSGIDVGYHETKVVSKANGHIFTASFPSIVGTGKPFIMGNGDHTPHCVVHMNNRDYTVGEEATKYRLPLVNVRKRGSIQSSAYLSLIKMAVSKVPTDAKIFGVTGLPVSYYKEDRAILKKTFMNEERFEQISVIPQPMGTYFYYILDKSGSPNSTYVNMYQNVVVVDIGRYTTDIAVVMGSDYIDELSGTVTIGVEYLLKKLREMLSDRFRNLDDLTLLKGIKNGQIQYFGKFYYIRNEVSECVKKTCKDIESYVMSLIGTETQIQKVVVTGGGVNIFSGIKFGEMEPIIAQNPVMCNAYGYMKYGMLTYNSKYNSKLIKA